MTKKSLFLIFEGLIFPIVPGIFSVNVNIINYILFDYALSKLFASGIEDQFWFGSFWKRFH